MARGGREGRGMARGRKKEHIGSGEGTEE